MTRRLIFGVSVFSPTKWSVEEWLFFHVVHSFVQIIGKPPFDSQTQHETIRMIRSIELAFPSGTSADLRDLITKVKRENASRTTIDSVRLVTSSKSFGSITIERRRSTRLDHEECGHSCDRRKLCETKENFKSRELSRLDARKS